MKTGKPLYSKAERERVDRLWKRVIKNAKAAGLDEMPVNPRTHKAIDEFYKRFCRDFNVTP